MGFFGNLLMSNEEKWELFFPEVFSDDSDFDSTYRSHTTFDIPAMELVEVSSDIGWERVRILDIRRRDGPVWEVRLQPESAKRELLSLEADRDKHDLGMVADRIAELKSGKWREWHAVPEWQTIEVAWQRFLAHGKGITPPSHRVSASAMARR